MQDKTHDSRACGQKAEVLVLLSTSTENVYTFHPTAIVLCGETVPEVSADMFCGPSKMSENEV